MLNTFAVLLLTLISFVGCAQEEVSSTDSGLSLSLITGFEQTTIDTVPVDARFEIAIDIDLNTDTLTESTIYIENTSGVIFPAYVTLEDRVITVQPKANLDAGTSYSLVVTTGLESSDGEHLSANSTISFSTGSASSDVTVPTLLSTLPLNNTSIDYRGNFYYQFSEDISAIGLDESSFTLFDNNATTNIDISVHVDGSLVHITADSDLIIGNLFTLSYEDTTIKDLAGNDLNSTLSDINFTTTGLSGSSLDYTTADFSLNYDVRAKIHTIFCDQGGSKLIFVAANNGFSLLEGDEITPSLTFLSKLDSSVVGKVYDMHINTTTLRAYLASSTGVHIVDISDTSNISLISSYATSASVYGVFSDENNNSLYLAVSDKSTGLIKLDVTNESDISLIYAQATQGAAYDVFVENTTITVAEYDQGVRQYDTSTGAYNGYESAINSKVKDIITHIDFPSDILLPSEMSSIFTVTREFTMSVTEYIAPTDGLISKYKYYTGSAQYALSEGIGLVLLDPAMGVINYYNFGFDVDNFGFFFNGGEVPYFVLADSSGMLYFVDGFAP